MSEPQADYDTDTTDTQPTPGPWTFDPQKGPPGQCFVAQVWDPDGSPLASIETRPNPEEATANARLIAAAGTSAQEVQEMGYDPVAAVEAVPHLISALHRLLETMKADDMEPGTLTPLGMREVAQDALAAARGDGDA